MFTGHNFGINVETVLFFLFLTPYSLYRIATEFHFWTGKLKYSDLLSSFHPCNNSVTESALIEIKDLFAYEVSNFI